MTIEEVDDRGQNNYLWIVTCSDPTCVHSSQKKVSDGMGYTKAMRTAQKIGQHAHVIREDLWDPMKKKV